MSDSPGTIEVMCGRCGEIADRPRPSDIPDEVHRVVTPCPDCSDGYLLPELWVTDSPALIEAAITTPHDASDTRR